ncbi:MAG: hypothetical protein K6A38_11110 [Lachnospiraceae bacterium]|nr:hypothetical protein [Lachnospiraceae bacterium]
MATKPINLKLDENRVVDVKRVAAVFHMTITEVINEALDAYLPAMKQDPFYKLTANVEDASGEETDEILSEIESLSDEDLEISNIKHFKV